MSQLGILDNTWGDLSSQEIHPQILSYWSEGSIISPRRYLLIHTHQTGRRQPLLKTKPPWLLTLAHSRQMQTPACFFSAIYIASCTPSATPMKKSNPSQHLHDGCLLTVVLREQDNDSERLNPFYIIYSHFCHLMGCPWQRQLWPLFFQAWRS